MFALDAASGQILWQFPAASSVNAGPAIVDGTVYWGSGYARAAEGSGNNKLFAFSIGGLVDTSPPTTAIALVPDAPNGLNGWYTSPVGVSVSATDGTGVGVYQTRCAVDPQTPPASFFGLPDSACSPAPIDSDGTHTVVAASEDNDNNVESPPVSRTLKIDRTAPTIVAAPTTRPNANGWYSGDVVVHFTCGDGGSGIPAGACPPDETLSGIGTAIRSTPATVADAAGNRSAPSNVVTVKIVNPAGLCALTRSDVRDSSRYRALGRVNRALVDGLVSSSCATLGSIEPGQGGIRTQLLVGVYRRLVQALRADGVLTATEAATLDTLAGGL